MVRHWTRRPPFCSHRAYFIRADVMLMRPLCGITFIYPILSCGHSGIDCVRFFFFLLPFAAKLAVTRFTHVFGICNTQVPEHDFSTTATHITMII
jgi:hypothetical protein